MAPIKGNLFSTIHSLPVLWSVMLPETVHLMEILAINKCFASGKQAVIKTTYQWPLPFTYQPQQSSAPLSINLSKAPPKLFGQLAQCCKLILSESDLMTDHIFIALFSHICANKEVFKNTFSSAVVLIKIQCISA